MTSYRKIILITAVIISYSLAYTYLPHTKFQGSKTVVVTKGLGSRKIGELLRREGFIESKWAFVTYVTLTGTDKKLKPGSYVFTQRATIPVIVKTLTGGSQNEVAITVPEGWNINDLASFLDERSIASREDFLAIAERKVRPASFDRFAFLKDLPEGATLEGYLFPDTYRIFRDATAEDIVGKMLANFDQRITPELREEAAADGRTLHEVVTMASLIEKEVSSDEDRAVVSGILWKRLAKGIPLQVDATVAYITGRRTTRISIDETKIDSPYNTYKYRGLPKGPISNPGVSAIRAAIYPAITDHLFYLSTPDGTTIFSETLDEHNIAKAKYLR